MGAHPSVAQLVLAPRRGLGNIHRIVRSPAGRLIQQANDLLYRQTPITRQGLSLRGVDYAARRQARLGPPRR
jgi:hypothetical protein